MQQEPPVSGGSYCRIVKIINNLKLLQNLQQTIQPLRGASALQRIFSAPILSRRLAFFISSSDAMRSFCIRLCAVLFCSSRNSSMERVFSSFLLRNFWLLFSVLNSFAIACRETPYFSASCLWLMPPLTYSAIICFR